MEAFTVHKGLVAPMDRANVDTDAIIPKQFLKSIRRSGFGPNLFDEWRYLDPGFPGQDPATRRPNPDFVLNQPRYKNATILLARKNFGCGSSREHAPWALDDYGFRAIIAPSFLLPLSTAWPLMYDQILDLSCLRLEIMVPAPKLHLWPITLSPT